MACHKLNGCLVRRRLFAGGGSHERTRLRANSLVTGKNTGYSAESPLKADLIALNRSRNQLLKNEIPYFGEQGTVHAPSGPFSDRTGKQVDCARDDPGDPKSPNWSACGTGV